MSRARDAMRAAVAAVMGPRALLERHEFQIVEQAADGKVAGELGETAKLPRASGVPIYVGLPGVFVRVKSGSRALLGFIGSDRKRRIVDAWEMVTSGAAVLAEMIIAEGTQGAARKGDAVEVSVTAVPVVGPSGPIGVTLTIGGVAIALTGPITIPLAVNASAKGAIVEGSSIVKIG